MSFLIGFSPYETLLRSNDEDTVKAVFQKLFELLVNGYTIPRSKRDVFRALVKRQISSRSEKVRRWAYHCACYCSPPTDDVCNSIIAELQKEKKIENILWGLTALSLKYEDQESLKQCVGKRHDEFVSTISENYLLDALVLFGNVTELNINIILDKNNTADLATLTKIYGYPSLVDDRFPEVTQDVIRTLERHNDPYLREYSFWAQALTASKGNYSALPDDPNDDVQKHLATLQLQNSDEDFICAVLKTTAIRPEKVSIPIKTGIMRGLSAVSYNSKYVPFVTSWFARETTEAIVIMLLDYIISNCKFDRDDGTYFDAIKDSLEDSILSPYIISKIEQNKKYGLVLKTIGDQKQLDFIKKGEQVMETMHIEISGTGHNVALAADNSVATATNVGVAHKAELDQLIQEIKASAKAELTEEQLITVNQRLNDILDIISQDQPKKTILDVLLDSLKGISDSIKFTSAVTKLVEFFKK